MSDTLYYPKRAAVWLHEAPDVRSNVRDEVLFGTKLEPTGEPAQNGFLRVRTAYGYTGYADTRLLAEAPEGLPPHVFAVTSPFCDLLVSPSFSRRPLITLSRGSFVHAFRPRLTAERFTKVFYAGHEVYAPTKALDPFEVLAGLPVRRDPRTVRKAVCDTALAYLGTPYRYGGKSASGVDCSGLCFMAYYLNGIVIARDAVFDRRYVYKISQSDLEAGDLLYFPRHVGLYIGGGEFVHASASAGYVTVSSLSPASVIFRRDLAESLRVCARSLLL